MKALILSALLVLSANSVHAEDNASSMVVGIVIGGTTYAAVGAVIYVAAITTAGPVFTTLDLSGKGFKVVVNAQEDASAFVATEGEVRTAALEQAFQVIRNLIPQGQVSDLELAQAIVAM